MVRVLNSYYVPAMVWLIDDVILQWGDFSQELPHDHLYHTMTHA